MCVCVALLSSCSPVGFDTDFTSSDVESYHGPSGSLEICRLRISGDSFLMYQIRNMIGLSVAVCRGLVKPEIIPATLAPPARTPAILGKRSRQAETIAGIHTYIHTQNLSISLLSPGSDSSVLLLLRTAPSEGLLLHRAFFFRPLSSQDKSRPDGEKYFTLPDPAIRRSNEFYANYLIPQVIYSGFPPLFSLSLSLSLIPQLYLRIDSSPRQILPMLSDESGPVQYWVNTRLDEQVEHLRKHGFENLIQWHQDWVAEKPASPNERPEAANSSVQDT